MDNTFIRTVTINGRPLVLRFSQTSEFEFEVSCVNERSIGDMTIGSPEREWKILKGGNEEMRQHSSRILSLLEDS